MKTYFSTIKNMISKVAFSAVTIMAALSFTACTSQADEPAVSESESVNVAQVRFTYSVPEELFKYAEITVCHNNDEGTDAKWFPMLDNKVSVDYQLSKFPVTAPVIMVYDTTNRPAYGIDVDWDITMDVEVSMVVGGQMVTRTHHEVYTINGDLGAGINTLMRNVLDRTYAVRISKTGNVEFVK